VIDAICVDQNNIPERNQQVQLMNDIYSNAGGVCVWLGEDPLRELQVFETTEPDMRSTGYYKNWSWIMRKIRLMRERRWQAAIKSLLDNPYCRRAWIVQEFMLAKSVLVIFGANGFISFEELFLWIQYDEHKEQDRQTVQNMVSSSKAGIELKLPFAGLRPTLWTLLVTNQDVACWDPRDRLYAFIGRASDREMVGIDIDYSLTMEELYAKVRAASTWHEAIAREVKTIESSCDWNLAFVREAVVDVLRRRYKIRNGSRVKK
jgi:hypothetical protein